MTTLINILLTIQFFYKMLFREDFRNPFSKISLSSPDKPIFLLGNGPSLASFLDYITHKEGAIDENEFFAVNSTSISPYFASIRPRYYILSDPSFFYDTAATPRIQKAIDALVNNVNWPMYLFVPYRFRNAKFINLYRRNKNITIVAFHSYLYQGLPSLRNWFYSQGLGNGEFGTVVLNAEYVAVMLGFKKIHLIGVEHSFFEGLCVNDNNIPCLIDSHFYDKDKQLKPLIWAFDNKRLYYSMSLYLEQKVKIFQGHEIMQDFATYMGAEIINNTPDSLIDAYKRGTPYGDK